MEILRLILIGIVIGMANVIPGVSGGTMAVVFNIYDKFINAITFNVKKLWENKRFVVPLLSGMAAGVLIFSKVITVLYGHFPTQTNYFFTGLIIGSWPLIFSYAMKKYDENTQATKEKIEKNKIAPVAVCVLIGIAIIVLFSILQTQFDKNAAKSAAESFVLPEISTVLLVRIFIAGIIGAVAMVIPGISGSLLMLVLGVYSIIMASIPALFNSDTMFHAFLLLLPNGIGVLIGLLGGAKLIGIILKKAPNYAYAVILGLLIGSAYNVCPFAKGVNGIDSALVSVVCLCAGFALAFFTSRTKEPETTPAD